MGNDEDWKKKRGKNREDCGTDGCGGMCPRHVIMARYRPGKTRATCHGCGATYKYPRNPPAEPPSRQQGGGGGGRAKGNERTLDKRDQRIQELQRQLSQAKAVASKANDADSVGGMDVDSPTDAVQKDINVKVAALKCFREASDDAQAGMALAMGSAEEQQAAINALRAKRRETLPPCDRQKGASENLKRQENGLKVARDEAAAIEKEKASLAEREALAKTRIEEFEVRCADAHKEVAVITAALAKELGAEVGAVAQQPEAALVFEAADVALLESICALVEKAAFAGYANSQGVSEDFGLARVANVMGKIRSVSTPAPTAQAAPDASAPAPAPAQQGVQAAPSAGGAMPEQASATGHARADTPAAPVEQCWEDASADVHQCMQDASLSVEAREAFLNLWKQKAEVRKKQRTNVAPY